MRVIGLHLLILEATPRREQSANKWHEALPKVLVLQEHVPPCSLCGRTWRNDGPDHIQLDPLNGVGRKLCEQQLDKLAQKDAWARVNVHYTVASRRPGLSLSDEQIATPAIHHRPLEVIIICWIQLITNVHFRLERRAFGACPSS